MEIILPNNNIYAQIDTTLYDLGNNELWLKRKPLIIEPTEDDDYHTIKENDQLTLIAYHYYKNFVSDSSKYWFLIANANPQIRNVINLKNYVGQNILIPNFNRVKGILS